MEGRTQRPFGVKLRDLLIEKNVTTAMGNPDWSDSSRAWMESITKRCEKRSLASASPR
jgi:hypothetical protein